MKDIDADDLRAAGVLCVEFGAKICQAADAQEAGDEVRLREILRESLSLIEALFRIGGLVEDHVQSIVVGESLSEEQVATLYQKMRA